MSIKSSKLLRALLAVCVLAMLGVGALIGDSWINGRRAVRLHAQIHQGMPVGDAVRVLSGGGGDVWVDPACSQSPGDAKCSSAGTNLHSVLGTTHTFSVAFDAGRVSNIKEVSVW